MSEWVDFGLYALQATLLWIVVPGWGARLLRPASAVHGDSPGPRRGWVHSLRAWGALSVLVLLAYRLDKMPPPLSAASLHKPGWEALLMTSNLMLSLGLMFAGLGLWRLVRWLKDNAVPQPRPEEAFALTRDDFLPRWLQHLSYVLLLCALAARPVAGLARPDLIHDVWGSFLMGLMVAALLFFAAAGSVMRAPNRLDDILGERYRWLEVNVCYLLMTCLALIEIAGLALELSGTASRRAVALLVAGFVSLTLISLMLLSTRQRPLRSAALEPDSAQ